MTTKEAQSELAQAAMFALRGEWQRVIIPTTAPTEVKDLFNYIATLEK